MSDPSQQKQPADTAWLEQYYTREKSAPRKTVRLHVPPAPGKAAVQTPLTVRRFDKYEFVESIGEGGMKKVDRAHDRDSDRDVALARVRGAADTDTLNRFVQEARIAARLDHPNIAPVYDVGLDAEGRPYFTMKLLRGESLRDILQGLREKKPGYRARYNLAHLLDIFGRVCDAVAFAHSKGVVHLDLKPSNIQVSDFDEVLVLDWGLARILGSNPAEGADNGREALLSQPQTLDGPIKGSPGYMAPEQAAGRNTEKDERTDIYSLGAILYSILTWQVPTAESDVETILAHTLAGKLIPPRKRAPERRIPPAIESVVLKAMHVDPARRYPSVLALARDVEAFAAGYATSVQSVGLLTLMRLLIKRNKRTSILLAASLIIIAVIGAISVLRIRASERVAVDALQRFRAEQEAKTAFGRLAAPRLLSQAYEQLAALDFDQAEKTVDLVLSLDETLQDAWRMRGILYLGRFMFAEAAAALAQASPTHPLESERGKKVRNKKPDVEHDKTLAAYCKELGQSHTPTPGEDALDELVDRVWKSKNHETGRYRAETVALIFLTYGPRFPSPEARATAVSRALAITNPSDRNLRFEYHRDEEGETLSLSGNPDLTAIAPLAGMPLTALDLSHTGVADIRFLKGMPLRRLNVSSTPVRDLGPVLDAPLEVLDLRGCRGLQKSQLKRFAGVEVMLTEKDQASG